jgi:hypothetical protein
MTKIEKESIHLLKNAYSHTVRSIIYHKKQNLRIQYACIAYFALINKKNVYEIQIRTHIQDRKEKGEKWNKPVATELA